MDLKYYFKHERSYLQQSDMINLVQMTRIYIYTLIGRANTERIFFNLTAKIENQLSSYMYN